MIEDPRTVNLTAAHRRYLRGLVRNATASFVEVNVDVLRNALAALGDPPGGIPDHVCGVCYHPFDRCSHCGDPPLGVCLARDVEGYGCELAAGHREPHESLRGLRSFRQWEEYEPPAPSPAGDPPGGAWQPIESAPKNGTWLLTWEDGANFVIAWQTDTTCRDGSQAWRDGECFPHNPTHWMPLPAAPVPDQTET